MITPKEQALTSSVKVMPLSTTMQFFIFDTGNNTLSKISLFPRKVEMVVTLNSSRYDSFTNHSGKFYLTAGVTIYELTTDGKLSNSPVGQD
ncbi:hypothetical protein YSY43_20930 [Paenibacillus sp. YSY-4.3]